MASNVVALYPVEELDEYHPHCPLCGTPWLSYPTMLRPGCDCPPKHLCKAGYHYSAGGMGDLATCDRCGKEFMRWAKRE